MNTKENTGYQRTHIAIQESLLQLAGKKGFPSVTVQDICKTAGINRSTFYAHYQDIFDVMETAKKREDAAVANRLKQREQEKGAGLSFIEYIEALLEHIRQNEGFYRLYLSESSLQYLSSGFSQFRKSVLEPVFCYYRIPAHSQDYYYSFFLAGMMNLIRLWLNGGCQDTPQQLAAIIASLQPEFAEEAFQKRLEG